MLAYALEKPVPEVLNPIRDGVRGFRTAVERGCRLSAGEAMEFALYGLAAAERVTTGFLLALPEERWADPSNRATRGLQFQVKTVFALIRGDAESSGEWLEVVKARGRVGAEPGLTELLEALVRRDGDGYNRALVDRMRRREDAYAAEARHSPHALLDLAGLGLCRIARERGLETRLRHVYLPLELLDVP